MTDPLEAKPSRRSEFIDELLAVMSYELCRGVLYHLQRHDGVASVADLVRDLSDRHKADPEAIAISLRQPILPRLDEIGAVDYDASSGRVLYRGGSFTTEFIDWIMNREADDD